MWRKIVADKEFWTGVEKIRRLPHVVVNHQGMLIDIPQMHTQALHFPWIHFREAHARDCMRYLLFWNQLRMVPWYCRNKCFKVFAVVDDIKTLYQVYKWAKASNLPGKVGIDDRPYTESKYLAVFYPDSWQMAAEYLAEIREGLKGLVEPDKIMVKRMCTEMEGMHPSPDDIPKELVHKWDGWEDKLQDICHITKQTMLVPEWIRNARWYIWSERAKKIGDMTYKELPFDREDVTFGPAINSIKYDPKFISPEELEKIKAEKKITEGSDDADK